MTLTRKLAGGGGDALVGIIMQLSGFVSRAKIQPEGQLRHLLILSVGTLVVLACGFPSRCASLKPAHPASCSETPGEMRGDLGYAQSEQTSAEHCKWSSCCCGMPLRLSVGAINTTYLNRRKPKRPGAH